MGAEELSIRLLALTKMLQEALGEDGAPPTSDGLRAELSALESMLRKQVEDVQPQLHVVDDVGPDEEHATG